MTRAAVLLILVLASASAAASVPTVKSAAGEVKIGRPGAWRTAKAGGTIREDEYLSVEPGAKVTVTIGDGSDQSFLGKAVLSGHRLAMAKSVLLSEQVRKQTFAGLDYDPNSTENAERGTEVGETGRRRRKVSFMGEEEEERRVATTDADYAEARLRLGDGPGAIDFAWPILANPDSSPLERCRAHLVMGRVAAADADVALAIREFDAAARPIEMWIPHAVEFHGDALLQRGQARMQGDDDTGASADFSETIAIAPQSASAAQANFFLGVLALSRSDADSARLRFAKLAGYPELSRAAEELLRSVETH